MLSEKVRSPPASQTRKITKSVMEKKRRARINTCLLELKSILGGMITHRGERFDKMEKADILEMTVNYVKQLQNGLTKDTRSKSPDEEYKNGVNTCISEVIKYVAANDLCDTDVKTKLLDHLADKITGTKVTQPSTLCLQHEPVTSSMISPSLSDLSNQSSDLDCNNNIQMSQQPNQPDSSTPVDQGSMPAVSSSSGLAAVPQSSFVPVRPLPILPATSQQHQTQTVLSNFPLAIVVPANLYSPSSTGTACVFAIPSSCGTQNFITSTSQCFTSKDNNAPQFVTPSVLSPQIVQSAISQQTFLQNQSFNQSFQIISKDGQNSTSPIRCSTITADSPNVSISDSQQQTAFFCPTVVSTNQANSPTQTNVILQSQDITNKNYQLHPSDNESDKDTSVQSETLDYAPTFHKKYRRHLLEARKPVWRPW